jgi:hypothetical protein
VRYTPLATGAGLVAGPVVAAAASRNKTLMEEPMCTNLL